MKYTPLGDVSRSVRLSEEVRWNHAHVLKAICGFMTRVDKISYGTVTAAIRTSRVESVAEGGVLEIWEKKNNG